MESGPNALVDEHQTQPSSSSSSSSSTGGGAHLQKSKPLPGAGNPGFMGKHRLAAAVSFLNQQIQIIQEELDQLETIGESSIVCKELVSSIESVPDALLPVSKGPAEVNWDRWFQGANGSRRHKKWI